MGTRGLRHAKGTPWWLDIAIENDNFPWQSVGLPEGKAWYTLWLFNIAMENGPFIDGLSIKNGDFPWLC